MGKIIVLGDINGQLSDAFGKLAKLHTKQSFSFAIIAGNLFNDPTNTTDNERDQLVKLLNGEIEVPLTTYFSLGNRPLPTVVTERLTNDEGELCPNLFVLGRKVSVKTSDGFKLVAIGGAHATSLDDQMNEYVATYTDKYVQSARDFKDADILITSDWPAGVLRGSKLTFDNPPSSNPSLGDLVATLKPRYHFSASHASYEREPFFHEGPPPRSVTRFISLAPLNNDHKHKALYAFSLEPSAPPPDHITDCTASPFIMNNLKRPRESQEDSHDYMRFSDRNGAGYHDQDRRPQKKNRYRKDEPRECYFCLANRSVEAHMITSIGEDAYMTIAKGPLSTAQTFPVLQHPCHMLIIPMEHAATFTTFENEENAKKAKAEMQRYRDSLHSLITAKSSTGEEGEAQLGAVTFEINRDEGRHLHWQFLPMPADLVKKSMIEVAFDVEAENLKYPKFAKTPEDIAAAEEGDFFKAMIWSESGEKEIVLPLPKSLRFDFQFGRRVLGKLLGLEKRTHWMDCVQPHDQESADAEAFKEIFKTYDFSLVEGEDET
ncbi:hypothetical protein M409DRAFT_62018 [Zasmidium cellare ATCC 36951]|uniref:Cwf19-like C-terminal domain-containing protein n=1 Tax=Zasmidium cellare ATCC 36951 TaxID=1080233 RepID=A0A6A6D2U9_ZASCE|nr:uncharacterized protein M409DRAFT_62018 [Zasmidium cellare ATCC 36951]KAF2173747.1 hypothetical protein M409DRAFT_62018 [Zasmidium cellare ATCC 36951]